MSALDDFTAYLAQAFACRPARLACDNAGVMRERLAELRGRLARVPVGVFTAEGNAALEPHSLRQALHKLGLTPAFVGRAPAPMCGSIAIFDSLPPVERTPEPFRVLAIVPAHNEEDVIAHTVGDLAHQGAQVYLIDNGSTDHTAERAAPFLGRGLLAIERFPESGAAETYDLARIMNRVEEIAAGQKEFDWIVLHDADERRRSPWPGVNLRDALWRVDRSGFTCIDHVTLTFWPTNSASFDPDGPDLEQQLRYFEFSDHPGHFHQRRAWKQNGARVSLAPSAGHDVRFAGRRVFPYKFLLKHYPIRSQAHGERKVLRERRTRWNAQERAHGWHRQYDDTGCDFVRDAASLNRFDPQTFAEEFLVQRLSGAGVFCRPPAWATAPCW